MCICGMGVMACLVIPYFTRMLLGSYYANAGFGFLDCNFMGPM
jgi:hypothetical protein